MQILILVLTGFFFFNTTQAAIESDSGVKYIPYDSIVHHLTGLAAEHPKRAQMIEYGRTAKGRPLSLLKIGNIGSSFKTHQAVEISGAIHGNEYLGIEEKIAAYFLSHVGQLPGLTLFLATGGVIYFVPVINPDGYEDRERENSKGTDLNRDFDVPFGAKRFNEIETKSLVTYLDQDLNENQLNLAFSLDYHCCLGALLMPWGYQDSYPKQSQLKSFNVIAELQKQTLGYRYGNPKHTVGYNAAGGSMDYFLAKYGTLAFAIEGKYRGEESVFAKHVQFLDSIFKMLAEKN